MKHILLTLLVFLISRIFADGTFETVFVDYHKFPDYFNATLLNELHDANRDLMNIRRYITYHVVSSAPLKQKYIYRQLTTNDGMFLNIRTWFTSFEQLTIINGELFDRGFIAKYVVGPNGKIVNYTDLGLLEQLPYAMYLSIQ